MKLVIYQVDAFAEALFKGNPAAICPLENWLSDDLMQNIAMENNLSETAYFVKKEDAYHIRWFTPAVEVDLCGHATLAAAYVIFEVLEKDTNSITFDSRSGKLEVTREENGMLTLNFPITPFEVADKPPLLEKALGIPVKEVYTSVDLVVVVDNQKQIENLEPNLELLKTIKTRGIIVTALGEDADFVSRFFAPQSGVNEDPVTGSAHTILTPFWSVKLGKTKLKAKQLSERGGTLHCELKNNRVYMSGNAKMYMKGTLFLN